MIGYYIDNQHIATSLGISGNGQKLKTLELFLGNSRKDVNIAYDLDANFACLLNHLKLEDWELTALNNKGKISVAPYTLCYYPKRSFSIDYGMGASHPFCNVFNARQFAYSKIEQVDNQQAVAKAQQAQKTGEEVSQALEEIGLPNYKLTSPICLYLKSPAGQRLDLPTVDDLPDPEIGEYAYQCLRGNWLEAYKIGYWPEAYDYDINGAYAYELSRLPDIRRGKWVKQPEIPEHAMLGFCKGLLSTWGEFHPFILKDKDGSNLTPVGDDIPTFLNLRKLQLLRRYSKQLGYFKIEDGWWWIPTAPLHYPLQEEMERLYNMRKEASPMANKLLHRIPAGLWGKMLQFQQDGKLGRLFNPVYGAEVESNTAARVAETCLQQSITPLHVAVDGIITDKPLNLHTNGSLGDWRLSHKGRCIIINAGTVGFENKGNAEEFSITFQWLWDAIHSEPIAEEYVKSKMSCVTLSKAIATNQLDKLGSLETIHRTIQVGGDNRRLWQSQPRTGAELLGCQVSSQPLHYNIIKEKN